MAGIEFGHLIFHLVMYMYTFCFPPLHINTASNKFVRLSYFTKSAANLMDNILKKTTLFKVIYFFSMSRSSFKSYIVHTPYLSNLFCSTGRLLIYI